MNEITTADAIAWFERRKAQITMPGANAMYDKAIAALRAQAEAEKNAPLTLEDLWEMDEEPVWICPPSTEDGVEWDIDSGEWALVDIDYELCRAVKGTLAVFEKYEKTWLAYRRKPEEGTT